MSRLCITKGLAVLLVLTGTTVQAAEKPLTVVELFTSQGCSSCPPADALLGELAEREDVLPLSQHVGYWDYLGWEDPFASDAVTDRQRAYARRFGLGYVYTPQIVVHGMAQVTGSDRDAVLQRIASVAGASSVEVDIVSDGDGGVLVSLGSDPDIEAADVWLAFFDYKHTARIEGGENGGRVISYHNVVRRLFRIGSWNGEAMTFPAAMPAGESVGDACAVIVQARGHGPILGAARLALEGD